MKYLYIFIRFWLHLYDRVNESAENPGYFITFAG